MVYGHIVVDISVTGNTTVFGGASYSVTLQLAVGDSGRSVRPIITRLMGRGASFRVPSTSVSNISLSRTG